MLAIIEEQERSNVELDDEFCEGITSRSPLFDYRTEPIEVPKILVIDYMHNAALGVAKKFLDALFYPKECQSQINPYNQGAINE